MRIPGFLILLKLLILLVAPSSISSAATVPAAGSVDDSFVFPQQASAANCFVLLPSGGFVAGFGNPNRLLRANPDGTQDSTFIVNLPAPPRELVATTNGHIICLTWSGDLLGFHPDGSVEFNSPTVVSPNHSIRQIRLTADNKLFIAGDFTNVYGIARAGIARLDAGRKLDESFVPAGINYPIDQIAVAPDGGVLIATLQTNSGPSLLRRLTSTGAADATFNTGTADFSVTRLEVMEDSRIYVGGEFKTFNGSPVQSLVRLAPDGTLDTNFHFTPLHPKGVYSIRAQRDGKILLATGSVMSNGVAGIVRINADGTHDTNFVPAIQTLISSDVAELPDGKVMAAGTFLIGLDQSRRVLVRLNAETLVIESWNPLTRALRFHGPAGHAFVLECATDLLNWRPILTNVFTSAPYSYSDPAASLPMSQFYRVRIDH